MINHNDVKMPVQKAQNETYSDEQVQNIEELLRLVNEAENKQELRLGEDYYAKFQWFGSSSASGRNAKSYFSYQEEAVYDFIFNLNKSGILSDQVGMGKTIEAGMIISELASRKELKSLLIVVPNEIMSIKWKTELEEKFGIRPRKDDHGEYPSVSVIRNYDDFCLSVFECLKEDKFGELSEYNFRHKYQEKPGDTLESAIKSFIEADIEKVIGLINSGFKMGGMKERVAFDGKSFGIKGTKLSRKYAYDADGEVKAFLNSRLNENIGIMLGGARFYKKYESMIYGELRGLYTLIGDYFVTCANGEFDMSSMTDIMAKRNPILVVPISYVDESGRSVSFLNHRLMDHVDSYKHKYIVKNASDNKIVPKSEEYRIIDFFIDTGYQTLIVDEVHDYIDVDSKVEREKYHKNENGIAEAYPSDEFDRYELFDDYYFIKKASLYKKLKSLADKANRKIFLTATPIKSDMVDFYLLTLLASNKDSDIYKSLQANLDQAIFTAREINEAGGAGSAGGEGDMETEEVIRILYNAFVECVEQSSAEDFCRYSRNYLQREKTDQGDDNPDGRYLYPYFNNSYLLANTARPEKIAQYLKGYVNYMSMEEIVMELMIAYDAESKLENQAKGKSNAGGELNAKELVLKLLRLLYAEEATPMQTRVVFRALLNNPIRQRFEEDFTDETGKPIKRIRELLSKEDGPGRWNKTYRKYGIRHTRHQTYNLSNCEYLSDLSANRISRYSNLPLWPRRNGNVIFLVRDDIFFDKFLKVTRERKEKEGKEVTLDVVRSLFSGKNSSDESDEERFEKATAIFDYINNSMSGGDGDHMPMSSQYESVELDDSGMIEYKLALVNRLMAGSDPGLGAIKKKVLLFAEKGREEILDWFRYQKCKPLYNGEELDQKRSAEYKKKWSQYTTSPMGEEWSVSTDTADLNKSANENVLIIIDPKRYEKGVDMQKADTIINFDINYDPLKMEQRIGRIDRIRPAGAEQSINIISFVPLNDMSGFVINFFANEMKMFTQWMGETTGIVSVPDKDEAGKGGGDISFEGRVVTLEKYYKYIYDLCNFDIESDKIDKMAQDYGKFFKTDAFLTQADFRFLNKLRPAFNASYVNSVSRIGGHAVEGSKNRVVRFNSTRSLLAPCGASQCDKCFAKDMCRGSGKVNNRYSEFVKGIHDFYKTGISFYQKAVADISEVISRKTIVAFDSGLAALFGKRVDAFKNEYEKVKPLLAAEHKESYPMPYDTYAKIFEPVQDLYWHTVVSEYLQRILDRFHEQCDSVLDGAKDFEQFVKSFAIADLMNNMKGTV